jgi:hypothetical protein
MPRPEQAPTKDRHLPGTCCRTAAPSPDYRSARGVGDRPVERPRVSSRESYRTHSITPLSLEAHQSCYGQRPPSPLHSGEQLTSAWEEVESDLLGHPLPQSQAFRINTRTCCAISSRTRGNTAKRPFSLPWTCVFPFTCLS